MPAVDHRAVAREAHLAGESKPFVGNEHCLGIESVAIKAEQSSRKLKSQTVAHGKLFGEGGNVEPDIFIIVAILVQHGNHHLTGHFPAVWQTPFHTRREVNQEIENPAVVIHVAIIEIDPHENIHLTGTHLRLGGEQEKKSHDQRKQSAAHGRKRIIYCRAPHTLNVDS